MSDLPLPVMMITGGIAGCIAEGLTIPLDTAKVRLQIQGEPKPGETVKYTGLLNTIKTMVAEEGVLSLFSGINAGFQRQLVFASLRIGLYVPVRNFYCDESEQKAPPLYKKILAGLTTGAIGITVANPTDLVKIRLQAEGKKSLAERRYTGVMDAYSKIVKADGLVGLWKGLGPNIIRNSVINATELATFDQVKEMVLKAKLMEDGTPCHLFSSSVAGFVAAVIGSPVDVLKTRVMNNSSGAGVIEVVTSTFKNEGFKAFYKGFNANAQRIVTWNIAMFVSLEKIRKIIKEKYYTTGSH